MALLRKPCPCCGTPIEFDESEIYAECPACETSHKVSQLMNAEGGATTTAGIDSLQAMFTNFDSSESGLVYVENKFANLDWDDYCKSRAILIEDVENVVTKNNAKFGAVGTTWYLDFISVATPVEKKIEGIAKLEAEIAAGYNGKDSTAVFENFDIYYDVVSALIDGKDVIVKRLENDVAFATKYGASAEQTAKMNETLATVKASLEGLKAYKRIAEIPAVIDAVKKVSEAKKAEYKAKGIDAEHAYNEAVQLYNSKHPSNDALRLFTSIRDYKDSAEYITKINKYFNFNGEYFNFLGKSFVFKKEEADEAAINPGAKDKKSAKKGCGCGAKKKKGGEEDEEYNGISLELFEVINERPSKEPVIKKISDVITVYANKLFYVKKGRTICAFDFLTGVEAEICTSKKHDLEFYSDKAHDHMYFNSECTKLYIRRHIEFKKPGCFGKKISATARKNSYAVIEIDLATNGYNEIIPGTIGIVGIYNNYIFFPVAEEPGDDPVSKILNKTSLRSYNTETGETKVILDDTHEVHNVVGTKVIYTIYTPNVWNQQLRCYDIATGKDVVIEDNIYDYMNVIDGKVFYTVGNADYLPLFSNNFEGTERVEVMRNVENIIAVVNNWMYVKKGGRYNNILIKVSPDGKTRIPLCLNFKQSVKINHNFVFYIDTYNNLCAVRADGSFKVTIAAGITASNVIVDDKNGKIYYLRPETVDYRVTEYSLYSMDQTGHNVRKLVFNVAAMKNFDDEYIYIKRNERPAFICVDPNAKKKKSKKDSEEEEQNVEILSIKRFYKFNKNTGELVRELSLGMPEDEEAKKGCGSKAKKGATYIELPKLPHAYTSIALEEVQEQNAGEELSAAEAKKAAVANGCGGANKNGGGKKSPAKKTGGCCGCSGKK